MTARRWAETFGLFFLEEQSIPSLTRTWKLLMIPKRMKHLSSIKPLYNQIPQTPYFVKRNKTANISIASPESVNFHSLASVKGSGSGRCRWLRASERPVPAAWRDSEGSVTSGERPATSRCRRYRRDREVAVAVVGWCRWQLASEDRCQRQAPAASERETGAGSN